MDSSHRPGLAFQHSSPWQARYAVPEPEKSKLSTPSQKLLSNVSSAISKATAPIDRNIDSLTSKARNAVKAQSKELKDIQSDTFRAFRKIGSDGRDKLKGVWSKDDEDNEWDFGEIQPHIDEFCYPVGQSPTEKPSVNGLSFRKRQTQNKSSCDANEDQIRCEVCTDEGLCQTCSATCLRDKEVRLSEGSYLNAARTGPLTKRNSPILINDVKKIRALTQAIFATRISANEEPRLDLSVEGIILKTISLEQEVEYDETFNQASSGSPLTLQHENAPRGHIDSFRSLPHVEGSTSKDTIDERKKDRKPDNSQSEDWVNEYSDLVSSLRNNMSLDETMDLSSSAAATSQVHAKTSVGPTQATSETLKRYRSMSKSETQPLLPSQATLEARNAMAREQDMVRGDEQRPISTTTTESFRTAPPTRSEYSASVYSRDSCSIITIESPPSKRPLASVGYFIDKMKNSKPVKKVRERRYEALD